MAESVDYDAIAAAYESRYKRNDYSGVEAALREFLEHGSPAHRHVAEVGCGTGHWLEFFRASSIPIVGIDPSAGMLQVARDRLPDARLIRARAEALPFRDSTFDGLFTVNALHHFTAPEIFFQQAHRLLASGSALLTIGLDPSTGLDRWWIYDYFPSALPRDRERYLPTARIRELMRQAGFDRCETREVQHRPAEMTVEDAARRGFLERTGNSQLMLIPHSEYEEGMRRVHEDNMHARGRMLIRADLRLYGTVGWTG